MDNKSPLPPLRGFTKPQSKDLSPRAPEWQDLDRAGKVARAIEILSRSSLIRKRKAHGGDAYILQIKNESGLAEEIARSPEGRAAIVNFISNLYRSEDVESSWHIAQRALKLFMLETSPEEAAKIHDAELDCRAYIVHSKSWSEKQKNEWLEDLTEEDKKEVETRAAAFSR